MNILIFTASTGGGHKRAAAALEAKIKQISPETTVNVVDGMKRVGRVYDKLICGGYHFMATKIPKVYGVSYKLTDKKTLVYKNMQGLNIAVAKRLLRTISDLEPDVILACHPFITTMLSKLKEKGYIEADKKIISIITDYDSHLTYIGDWIDAYVVAEPHMKKKITEIYGVDERKIHPLGIPIFDSFTQPFNKEEICKKEGIDPNKPTVLLMAGSFGVSGVLDFYKKLAKKSKGLQFIVITGKNQKLYEHFENLVSELHTEQNTKLLYFVDNVYDYMHISDIIVTKPGGLTVTESLACHLPLAIYSAFPGQELDNATFLTNQNAAVLLDKKHGAEEIISLINKKDELSKMKEVCKSLAMPDSAENIFRLAQQFCKSKEV